MLKFVLNQFIHSLSADSEPRGQLVHDGVELLDLDVELGDRLQLLVHAVQDRLAALQILNLKIKEGQKFQKQVANVVKSQQEGFHDFHGGM